MMLSILFAAALQAAPAAGPAAPPQAACDAPALVDRPGITPEEANRTADQARAYAACMTRYIEARRAKADALMVEYQTESGAVNAAIAEANRFVARYNSWQDQLTATPGQ